MCAVTLPIWPGSGSAVTTSSLSTPFGFYDADTQFQADAPRTADWVAKRLGYPIQDIELQDVQIYACFEEAITEYSNQVNQFNAIGNLLHLQGTPSGANLTHRNLNTGLGKIIQLSEQYGQEALVGGHVELRRAHFQTSASVQTYDLWTAVSESYMSAAIAAGESGSVPPRADVEIKRVWHYAPPSIVRYFDPFAGTGMGTYSMLQEFGWTNYSVGTSFMMLPIYADILRLQAIEFNDQVRRSGYGFELINNKIRIFPIPSGEINIWFDYIFKSDRDNPQQDDDVNASLTGVSDISNVRFDNMVYSLINHLGKQWIRNYTLALCKVTLGHVRGKYATIPIPNENTTLDGADLKTQGEAERIALIEQLRTTLDLATKSKQLSKEAEDMTSLQKTLTGIPIPIYIG